MRTVGLDESTAVMQSDNPAAVSPWSCGSQVKWSATAPSSYSTAELKELGAVAELPASDPPGPSWWSSAKLFNYAKWEKTSKALFVLFAVVFMVTRLIVFPFWLIHCTWVYPVLYYPAYFGYYFFNLMLVVLLCLHVFWTYLILCMIRKFMFGQLTRDERSDNDEEEGQETSPTEDEGVQQHTPVSGREIHGREDKNGCFGISPPENLCWSKTM